MNWHIHCEELYMIGNIDTSLYIASRLVGTSGSRSAIAAAQKAQAQARFEGHENRAAIWDEVQSHLQRKSVGPGLVIDIKV